MRAHVARVLERHPVEPGELQVRQAVTHPLGLGTRAGEPCPELLREPREAGLAPPRHGLVRIVGAEEAALGIGVVRDQAGHAPGHPRVARERGVFRPGKLQALNRARQEERGGGGQGGEERGHRPAPYRRWFTA